MIDVSAHQMGAHRVIMGCRLIRTVCCWYIGGMTAGLDELPLICVGLVVVVVGQIC